MADEKNRLSPSVYTRLMNKVAYSTSPLSDTIAFVGPANSGALGEVLSFDNYNAALNTLGACRMTDLVFAAYAGNAKTIKCVRIGGTNEFDTVLFDASPDDVVGHEVADITSYMQRPDLTINDFYDAYAFGTPGDDPDAVGYDPYVAGISGGGALIILSAEKFDTLDFRISGTLSGSSVMQLGYFNNNQTASMNGRTGFDVIPNIEANGTSYVSSNITVNSSSFTMEWDLDDIADWQQTSFIDDDGLAHNGYAMILWRDNDAGITVTTTDGLDTVPGWNFSRIARRIGAEAPYSIMNNATFVGGTGIILSVSTTPVTWFKGLDASADTIVLTFKKSGINVNITVTKTDSFGREEIETFQVVPSYNSLTTKYEYTTEAVIETINATSNIIEVEDLSGVYTMFGWTDASDGTEYEVTLSGGSTGNASTLNVKDYARGYNVLRSENDAYWQIPCIPDEVVTNSVAQIDTSKFAAIMAQAFAHVQEMSDGIGAMPRVMFAWLCPAYQNVGTIDNSNLNIYTGSVRRPYTSNRIAYFVQKLGMPESEDSGSIAYRRDFLAAYTAGLLANLFPAVPGTRKPLQFGALDFLPSPSELEVLIRNGVFAYTKIDGIGTCIGKAITTELSTIYSSISARRIADKINVEATSLLERRFIGKSLEEGVANEIEKAIIAYLDSVIAPAELGGLIVGYDGVQAVPSQTNPNKILLSYDVYIKTDLDFIDQDIYMRAGVAKLSEQIALNLVR